MVFSTGKVYTRYLPVSASPGDAPPGHKCIKSRFAFPKRVPLFPAGSVKVY